MVSRGAVTAGFVGGASRLFPCLPPLSVHTPGTPRGREARKEGGGVGRILTSLVVAAAGFRKGVL